MEIIVIIMTCLFLLFDTALLKKRALPIFESVFYFPRWEIAMGIVFLALAVLKVGSQGLLILQVFIFAFAMIYLIRRGRFLSLVRSSPQHAVLTDENLGLAISTLSILAIWCLGTLVMGFFVETVQAVFHFKFDELTSLLLYSELSSVLLIVLIYRVVTRYKSLKLLNVLGLETKGIGALKIWVLPAVSALIYAVVTSLFLEARPIQPITPLQELLNSTTSVGVLLLFVTAAILTAPFFEEIIFRGFLFHVMRPYKGVVFTVFFVALIFGLLHVEQYWGDWDAIVVVGLFGLSLTLFRAWTGSAVPGMIAHYVYNTSLTILPMIMVVFASPIYFQYQMEQYRLNSTQKEERLLQSITQYPQFGSAYNDLAWLYSEEEINLDRALELVEKALALEPDNYAFLDTKAEVLYKMYRISEAIAIEEDLIKKYPNDPYLKKQLQKFRAAVPTYKSIDI